MWRRTGAIFWLTRPTTIIRSAWRGEARKTSMPKRPESKWAPPMAIISSAQQARPKVAGHRLDLRSEEHTSELQSLMRISYAVFCLKKKKKQQNKKEEKINTPDIQPIIQRVQSREKKE